MPVIREGDITPEMYAQMRLAGELTQTDCSSDCNGIFEHSPGAFLVLPVLIHPRTGKFYVKWPSNGEFHECETLKAFRRYELKPEEKARQEREQAPPPDHRANVAAVRDPHLNSFQRLQVAGTKLEAELQTARERSRTEAQQMPESEFSAASQQYARDVLAARTEAQKRRKLE